MGYAPLILVVAYDSPFKTFDDLIKAAKADPKAVSFATSGSGSAPHLASELLKITTKTEMLHVPYKGGSPAKLDLVTGRVSFMFLNPLNLYINHALQDNKVQAKLEQMAIIIGGGSVADFNKFFLDQVSKWAGVVKAAGLNTQ